MRGKILFTIMMIAIYRLGSHIVLPGIDPTKIDAGSQNGTGILGLIDAFSGGAFNNASHFCIGYYALYLCIYLYAVDDNCISAKFSKNAERRGEWP